MLRNKSLREDPDSYLAAERRSLAKEWERFKEHVKVEDGQRDKFMRRLEEKRSNALPEAVKKFISTVKFTVRATMNKKGGTPFSIIRQMFLYWDRERTGKVTPEDLQRCMLSLGVKISPEEIKDIVVYYNGRSGNPGAKDMTYDNLLQDVQEGEPGLTAFALDSDTNAQPKARYAFESEKYAIQPPLIKQFIQAVRLSVMKRMVREGGTPFSIVRQIFMLYDLNYSSSLNAAELIPAMRKGMGLVFTEAHAAEIGKFYNRDGTGEFGYQIMLKDIVENFPSMLDFSATSASYISSNSKGNPFVKPEFHLKDNKTVESFRTRLLQLLEFKIAARGGSVRSLIRDAFIFWDSRCCGKLKSVQEVLGALKRLGVDATTDEAQLLMSRYDPENDGEMHYNSFIEDMARYELSFLSDTGTAFDTAMSPTARSPANVSYSTQLIRSKADGFARKSGGKLVARDILHGTFLKHDSGHQGRVSMSDLKAVCADLQVSVSDAKLQVLLSWFDSNGTNSMDYNAFIDQLYGSEGLDGTEKVKRATYHLLDHFKEGMMADSPATKKMSKRALKLKEEEERRTASMARMKAEKALLKNKLVSIDLQKKALEELRHK